MENIENNDEYEKLKKFQSIKEQALKEFLKQKWKQFYHLKWRQDPNNIDMNYDIKDYKELDLRIKSLSKKTNKKYKNYFITITTPPETDKLKFINGCKKLFQNAVIHRGYMVIEQRGETEETVGDGLHCHMLIFREDKYAHSRFTNRLLGQLIKLNINSKYKNVKQLLKLANLNSAPFSFQNIKDETVEKKLSYIQGNKNDEKLLKVQFDKVFRKKFDLQEIYKKNI